MLRDRLIFGPLLIVGLIVLLWLDQTLGAVAMPTLQGPGFRVLPLSALIGRESLPPGLLMALAGLALMGGGAREFSVMFAAKGVSVPASLLWVGAAVGLILLYASPGYGAVQPQLAWFATWLIVVVLIVVRGQTLNRRSDGALTAAGAVLVGIVYLGLLPGFYLAMRQWYSA